MNVPTFDDLKRIYCAGSKPTIEQIQDFVESQPDLNFRDERESTHPLSLGRTILHWAADRGHRDAIHILIDCGASVDSTDGSGMTPLHLAIDHDFVIATQQDRMPDYFPTAFALLCHGADDSIADEDGRLATDFIADFDGMMDVYESVRQRAAQHARKA